MTVARPTPFQTSTTATEIRAVWASPSQSDEVMPNRLSTLLTSPVSGWSRTLNVIPTATVLTSTGKNTTERRNPRDRRRAVSRTARSMPRTTLALLVRTA
jgi:hypothetical protein